MSRRSKIKTAQGQTDVSAGITPPPRWVVPGICVLLAAMVCAVFGQTLGDQFVNYDDNSYVYENPHVRGGLSLQAVRWALNPAHGDLNLWTPLTAISHMLDCQIFGLKPWGHHLTNVLLHTATVIALFLVLRQMTGALWRSAFVAAVFAIHPLHVESAAWVAERKDVLSGLFFVLTLWAWLRYVRGPSVARYAMALALFALGIMAKQMIVTLPFLLLLLDYWPLKRFVQTPGSGNGAAFFRLVVEKIPLFALTAASCAQTYMAGKDLRPVMPVAHPFLLRAGNALVCYVVYICQMFYTAKLAVFYPFPAAVPAWQALGALLLLAGISTAAFVYRRKQPAFLTGWLWYLGMLVPVIGFIPLGREAHADRYTYLPQIGLYIAIAWLAADACARLRLPRMLPGIAMASAVAVLAASASIQATYWKDDETLWSHALEVIPDNAFAQNNLGKDRLSDNDAAGAIDHFREALAIQPDYPEAYNNMGVAFFDEKNLEGAVAQYRKALDLDPKYPDAHNNLGRGLLLGGDAEGAIDEFRKAIALDPRFVVALKNLGDALHARGEKGDTEEALAQFHKAIGINPDYADAHRDLANTLLMSGRLDEALDEYEKTLAIDPGIANAQFNLARILLQKGRVEEAVAGFQKALQVEPDDPDTQIILALVLATCPQSSLRNGAKAVELAQEANQSTGGDNPNVLATLAAAYAETGKYSEASATAQLALELAESRSDAKLAEMLRSQLALYQAGMPFHDNGMMNGSPGQP